MQRIHPILLSLVATALAASLFTTACRNPSPQQADRKQFAKINEDKETPELAEHMRDLSYYTHKLSLAVEAEHGELADFYLHEVTAKKDVIKEDVPGYEGYDIAYFTGFYLDPTVDSLTTVMKSRDWNKIQSSVDAMVQSCNTCHNATSHGFIQVTAGTDENPYNQIFEKR